MIEQIFLHIIFKIVDNIADSTFFKNLIKKLKDLFKKNNGNNDKTDTKDDNINKKG